MIRSVCEMCGKGFEQEYQDEYDLCDECLEKLANPELEVVDFKNGWNLK